MSSTSRSPVTNEHPLFIVGEDERETKPRIPKVAFIGGLAAVSQRTDTQTLSITKHTSNEAT